jgi:hypothetical protein
VKDAPQEPNSSTKKHSCSSFCPGKGLTRNQNGDDKEWEDMEEDDDSEEESKDKDQTKEQKADKRENEKEKKQEEKKKEEKEVKENETESQGSNVASGTRSLPPLCLSVLSGADPELGPQLQEAAASGENCSLLSSPNFVTPQSSHFSV